MRGHVVFWPIRNVTGVGCRLVLNVHFSNQDYPDEWAYHSSLFNTGLVHISQKHSFIGLGRCRKNVYSPKLPRS